MYMCPYVSLSTWKTHCLVCVCVFECVFECVCVCVCVCICTWVSLGISKTNRHLRGEKRGRGQREEVRRDVNASPEQWMRDMHARAWVGGGGGRGVAVRAISVLNRP